MQYSLYPSSQHKWQGMEHLRHLINAVYIKTYFIADLIRLKFFVVHIGTFSHINVIQRSLVYNETQIQNLLHFKRKVSPEVEIALSSRIGSVFVVLLLLVNLFVVFPCVFIAKVESVCLPIKIGFYLGLKVASIKLETLICIQIHISFIYVWKTKWKVTLAREV